MEAISFLTASSLTAAGLSIKAMLHFVYVFPQGCFRCKRLAVLLKEATE